MDQNPGEVSSSPLPAPPAQDNRGGVSVPRLKLEENGNDVAGERAESPDTNCAICLGKLQNKSFTDSCLHPFCFNCLLEWSKIKAECPLCKQSFKSIIHNVRSIEDYDQYHLRPSTLEPRVSLQNISFLVEPNNPSRSFRYRTTMTHPVYSYLQQFEQMMTRGGVDHSIPHSWSVIPNRSTRRSRSYLASDRNNRNINVLEVSVVMTGPSADRRNIYNRDLWVRRVPDVTGRFRECSPEFFVNNPAQVHRLVPWLNRELNILLPGSGYGTEEVLARILSLLPRHHIRSREFKDAVLPYFGGRTDHFIHEFYSFGTSPFDMIGYDNNISYGPPFSVAHDIHDDVDSSDSDIEIIDEVSTNNTASQTRNVPSLNILDLSMAGPSRSQDSPNELIAVSSGIDSDPDECQIVGTIKPRHLRTPEIITLDDSDMDVNGLEEGETRDEDEEKMITPLPVSLLCYPFSPGTLTPEELSVERRRNPFYTRPWENAGPCILSTGSESAASSSREDRKISKKHVRKIAAPKRKKRRHSSSGSTKKVKESKKKCTKDKKKPIRHWKKKLCRRIESSSSSEEAFSSKCRKVAVSINSRKRRVQYTSSESDSDSDVPNHAIQHSDAGSQTSRRSHTSRLRSVVHVRRDIYPRESNNSSCHSRSKSQDTDHGPSTSSQSGQALWQPRHRDSSTSSNSSAASNVSPSSSDSSSSSSSSSRRHKYRRKGKHFIHK